MDKWQAQYNFWSGFGIPAYEQNSVPDQNHIQYPYLTYEGVSSRFDEDAYITASVWTRSESWEEADAVSDSIETSLNHGGVVVNYNGGKMWFTAGVPFSRSMGDPNDDMVKRKLLSITIHF